jgi:hypothetical protein
MDQRRKNKAVKQTQPNNKSAPGMSKSARRRMRSRQGKTSVYTTSNTGMVSGGMVQPKGTAPIVGRTSYQNTIKSIVRASKMRISDDGLSFLKCAFAPPDFANYDVKGVPDDFQGKSLVKKHRLVSSQSFNTANTDYYFLVLPTPGYAYWTASVPAGTNVLATTAFTGVPYSDCANIFNSGGTAGSSTAAIVDKFRYVSNHFELVPTSNQMIWTGNVQAWRFPAAVFVRQNNYSGSTLMQADNIFSISGLQSTNATNADQYTGPFNLGVYTAAYNTGANFDFSAIPEYIIKVPTDPFSVLGDFGQLLAQDNGFAGFDNQFDSIVVKVSGMGSNASNTAILKAWACVEYQALPGSGYYEFQSLSPCDPVALDLYRKIINQLPPGVSFVDNEGFWQRVLQIIRQVSGGLSFVPGPYGMAAGGVNKVSEALEQMFF